MTRLFPSLIAIIIVSSQLAAQTLTSIGAGIVSQTSSMGTLGFSGHALLGPLEASKPFVFESTLTFGQTAPKYPLKKNIVTTVFWVGEAPAGANETPNYGSSWDPNWMSNYGGLDDPDPARRVSGYRPAAFVPRLNPFYFALPYNDCIDYRRTKAEAARVIPWFKEAFKETGKSVCKNRWIAIRHGERTCYAQWSDCGPWTTSDAAYVFGDARPVNAANNGAGLDVAPAVRDHLGLKSGGTCDWRFVDEEEVPDGPWKTYGTNNPFSKEWKETPDDKSPAASKPVLTVAKSGPSKVKGGGGIPGVSLRTVSSKASAGK